MAGQHLADRRSLALHREVASRLRADPTLVERARARVERDRQSGGLHPRWASVWTRLLALPVAELAQAIEADTAEMADVRQTTPFAGVLSPRERWAIWRRASGPR